MTSERYDGDGLMSEEERLLEQLSALIDGELDDAERANVEDRLTSDAAVRETYDDLRAIRTTLATLDDVPAPRSFALPATAPAPARRPFYARFDFLLRIGSAAAALLFVVALAGGGSLQTASVPAAGDNATTIMAGAAQDEGSAGTLAAGGGSEGEPREEPPAAQDSGAPEASDGDIPMPESAGDATGGEAGDFESDSASDGGNAAAPGTGDTTELQPSGFSPPSSDESSIGGVTIALGAVAVLLAVLSVIVSRQQRSASRR